jgi:hypothetical protein
VAESAFGFKVFAGDASQGWLIMKNGGHAIGPFHPILVNQHV